MSAGCGGAVAIAAQPGGPDPFFLREDRSRVPPGRPERFGALAPLTPVEPAAPEPPPPRA
jgi:hypothetical protein